MKNLAAKGLSMSQASSISNLCNQRAIEIENELGIINNSKKILEYGGKELIAQQPHKIPANVIELVLEKGKLHATQAFLMENIVLKDVLIKTKSKEKFTTSKEKPKHPELKEPVILPLVKEDWGWEKLSKNEMAEYLEAEAIAAAVGKFIHKGSILDNLRKELPGIKTLEWMTIPGSKGDALPMTVSIHHESKDLLTVHENLAAEHRKYEQKVNYYKAKVKNAVTEENARISKENANEQSTVSKANADLMKDFDTKSKEYTQEIMKDAHEFEANRQNEIKRLAALRIEVHTAFQPLVDEFLKKLGTEPTEVGVETEK